MAYGNKLPFDNQRYGDTIYHRGSQWDVLHAGTSGQFLQTKGINKAPVWAGVTGKIVCYDAIVDSTGTYGTHTTIASALTAVKDTNNARVLIFGGTYAEALVPAAGTSSMITLEGCPPWLDVQWAGDRASTPGVTITPSTNAFCIDLTTATTTAWLFKGIQFFANNGSGGSTTGAVKASASNISVIFQDCYLQTGNGSSQDVYLPNTSGSGNGKFTFIRCYGDPAGTNRMVFNYVGNQTAPVVVVDSCDFQRGGFNVDGNTAGTLYAYNSRIGTQGATTITASSINIHHCLIGLVNGIGISVTKQVGVSSFHSITDNTFYGDTFNQASTAILLRTGGDGVIEGNRFTVASGSGLKWAIDVGAGVSTTILGNEYLAGGGTITNAGTINNLDPLESRSPVTAHNILSVTHGDTTANAVVRGDLITGQGASPTWNRLAITVPAANQLDVVGVANGDTEVSHKLLLDGTTPGNSAVGDAAAAGTSLKAAHVDHAHGREAFVSPSILLGTAGAAGVATTLVRSDSTLAAFDTTVPTTIAASDAAATGSIAFAARRDHKHGAPATYAATAHNLLSTTHGDTATGTPVRGDLAVANSTPAWSKLALGINGQIIWSNGTDPSWTSNPTIVGYARVGSASAPSNTTAGDITGIRGHFGTDATFTAGMSLEVRGGIAAITGNSEQGLSVTNVSTASGGTGFIASPTFAPTAGSPVFINYAGLTTPVVNPAAGITLSNMVGQYERLDYQATGAVTTGYSHYVATPTSGGLKPGTQYGIYIADQGLAGITTSASLRLDKPTGSTNKFYLYLDTDDATIPVGLLGRWAINVAGTARDVPYVA